MVNYRKIFWSKTPSSWKSVKLGSILKGKNKKFGNENKKSDPVVFSVSNEEGFVKSEDYFDKEVPSEDLNDYKIIEKGQFAYNPARINVGSIAFLSNNEWGLVSPMYEVFSVDRNETTTDFIKYFFFSDKAISLYKAFSQGSVRQVLKFNSMKDIPYSIPPLPEQNKIAEVLSPVDEAIQKTEEIIEHTKELKKGLMQDLLTKGIGHEKFKEVQLGGKSYIIPKEWRVKRITEICKINLRKFNPREYKEETFKYIDIDAVSKNSINNVKTIKTSEAPSRAARKVISGNILVSTVRPYLQGFAQVNAKLSGSVCSTGFAVLEVKNSFLSDYILQSVLSNYFLDQMKKRMTGTSYPSVTNTDFRSVQLFLPSLQEQKKIANILSTVDEKIRIEKEYKEKLEKLKKGLMQDLLTGKVRVLPLLSEEEKEELKEADVPG